MGHHIAGSEVTVPNGRGKQRKDNDGATSQMGNTGQQHHVGQHNNNKDEDMMMVEEAKNNNNVEHATKKKTTESRNITNSQSNLPLPR
jgi:hypothetical protein